MQRLALLAALALAGCATSTPRFDQSVATTFAHEDMRRLVTADVELYYPAKERAAAELVAARAAECLRELRGKQVTQRERGRALIFLTTANFNNAYVAGQTLGEPLQSLAPLSTTDEIFHWYGLSNAEAGDITCHEMFHYAHFEQVENFWRFVNAVVGPVMPSQSFSERWFTEGVAQYYEGRIHRANGRPNSPLYRGAFDSFVALRKGSLGGGDLSIFQRELTPYSGAYLTGLFFVEWLASKYGEDKLWQLMDVQGRAFFTPLGATLRFKSVYGLSVGALLDEWSAELSASLAVRERPKEQQVLRARLGQLARLAVHAGSGTMAVVSAGNEEVPMLRILEADGTVRVERRLTRLTTDREWVFVGPYTMTGLGFSGDGRWLFAVNDDVIERGDTRGQIWKIDASTGETVRVWQKVGRIMGGAPSPDGLAYTFVDFSPGHARIVERELESGAEKTLLELPPGVAASALQWSPDGRQLVFSRLDGNGWNLVLRREDGSLAPLTTDGAFNYGARWSDATHVVFARTAGKYLQVHRLDVESGRLEQLTDAPYGVVDPAASKDRIAFVNRDGVGWSLDVAPATPRTVVRERFAEVRLAQVESGEPRPPDAATDAAPAPAAPTLAEPPARHEPPKLVVEEDEAYSTLDHLFVPQLRLPGVLLSTGVDENDNLRLVTTVSASLSGRDRLSQHNWALNAALSLPTLDSSVGAAYVNMQLAPWYVAASGSRDGYADEAYWSGAVSTGRTVYTTDVSFAARTEIWQPMSSLGTQKFIGPSFSVGYGASESTAYGGVQRQLGISLDASAFPRAIGSDRDVFDLRVGIALAAPLPVSTRHSLTFSISGRALPGAPEGALRVGGVPRGVFSWLSQPRNAAPGPKVFLPGSFVESVRGFDDFAIRANAMAQLNARYRYSFIIDRGFASLLWLFPSIFFRQVDVEAFGVAAATDNRAQTWARAAGAAVTVRAVGGGFLGLSLYGQFAWRFDAGLPPLFSAGLAFE